MSGDTERLLGEIKGKLDMVITNQQEHGAKIESIDNRLHRVESKSAMLGAGAGALVSVGLAILIEKGKKTIGL